MKTNLRKLAKGKPCMIRIPGYCNHDQSRVVLCHDNLAGVSGMGMKAPDLCGAWGCDVCHGIVDGRIKAPEFSPFEIKIFFYEGMSRTLAEISKLD